MTSFHLSQKAKIDLRNIAQYTIETWGHAQTIEYINQINASCQKAVDKPYLGRQCDHIRPGLQRIQSGKHMIFYRLKADAILVSRILHEKMQPEHHEMED